MLGSFAAAAGEEGTMGRAYYDPGSHALIALATINPDRADEIIAVFDWVEQLSELWKQQTDGGASGAEIAKALERAWQASDWLLQSAPIGTRLH
jgi:hypothetical protein